MIKRFEIFVIPLAGIFVSFKSFGDSNLGRQCVINPDGHRQIAESFHRSQEPPVRHFFGHFQNIYEKDGAVTSGHRGPVIKVECLVASLRRTVAGDGGFSCALSDGSGASPQSSARRLPRGKQCITSDMLSYIQSSVSNAANCVSQASGIPVDMATTYQKINNESAFQFYHSNPGGTGIGQLTSWPLRDMYQARPRLYSEVLSKIQSDPNCANFKSILDEDRRPSGSTLFPRQKMCKYISPGEGLNRNLLYSFVFMSQLKRRVLNLLPSSFLDEAVPSDEKRKRVMLVERLALVGYGPEGMARAQGLARSLRAGSGFNVDAALRRVTGGSSYLRAVDSKAKEAIKMTNLNNVSECVGAQLKSVSGNSINSANPPSASQSTPRSTR